MLRTYTYPLEPNRRQEGVLEDWLTRCRHLYNAALEQRRDAWKDHGRGISYNQQTKELTDLRASDPAWRAVPVEVARSALRNLDRAFQAFFRRVKRKEKPGYPRFRARDRYACLGLGRISVEGKKVRIPKMGLVRFRKYRDLGGTIREARAVRTAGRWFICFVCDLGEAPAKTAVSRSTGIDLGLNAFAVLSSGERVENPRYFRRAEDAIARRQRALARRKRGSRSRARARLLVAKAHEHVRQQRLDFARKLACEIYRKYDLVAYENLTIRGMARSRLSKSVADASWGTFIGILASKAECAGKWAVPVDPRGTTQRCSGCEKVVHKTIEERTHRCGGCGLVLDRDHNAALNILALGRSVAPGAAQSPNLDTTLPHLFKV